MKHARITAVAGVVVTTLVLGLGPASGEGVRPSNDDFGKAKVITSLPYADSVNLAGARLEASEPQSTCGTAKGSVWYQFTSEQNLTLVAEAASEFKSVMNVYAGTSFSDLTALACDGKTTNAKAEFNASPGQTYLIQLGALRRAGMVDFSLTASSWQEKEFFTHSLPVVVSDTGRPAVTVQGRPNAKDSSMYELTITAADQPSIKKSILTFGLVREQINAELVRIPRQAAQVDVSIGYRYDASQHACTVDDPCAVKSPVKDLTWLTSGDGSRAEMVIRIRVTKDDQTLAERMLTVPYAGQVLGLL